MTAQLSSPPGHALSAPSVRRLGERTCIIEIGTDLRHTSSRTARDPPLPPDDGEHDYVFDLCLLRRYEPFALVRLARQLDRSRWAATPSTWRRATPALRGPALLATPSAGSSTARPRTRCASCSPPRCDVPAGPPHADRQRGLPRQRVPYRRREPVARASMTVAPPGRVTACASSSTSPARSSRRPGSPSPPHGFATTAEEAREIAAGDRRRRPSSSPRCSPAGG